MADMNDQAKNWVWDYANTVNILCRRFFPQDPQRVEDMTHEVLIRISQKDRLDKVGDRSSWIRTVAYHECVNYFRELNRQPVLISWPFEDHGVGADEKLSDAKLDEEAKGSSEDIENETDKPEKIDPVELWHTFKRDYPKMAEALLRSLFFVSQAFREIKSNRDFIKRHDQDAKLFATLQDALRQIEKIHGPFLRGEEWPLHIRELKGFLAVDLADEGIKYIGSKPYYNYKRGVVPLTFHFCELKDGAMKGDVGNTYIYHHRMRIRDFIHVDPDPLYVLYRVWNRILIKGKEGKYGNRKLLKVLLFAFKKIAERLKYDNNRNTLLDDTLNSRTEETKLETLRTMSCKLNKGYSELADFIFRKSVRPPKRKTTATDEKKQAPLSSI